MTRLPVNGSSVPSENDGLFPVTEALPRLQYRGERTRREEWEQLPPDRELSQQDRYRMIFGKLGFDPSSAAELQAAFTITIEGSVPRYLGHRMGDQMQKYDHETYIADKWGGKKPKSIHYQTLTGRLFEMRDFREDARAEVTFLEDFFRQLKEFVESESTADTLAGLGLDPVSDDIRELEKSFRGEDSSPLVDYFKQMVRGGDLMRAAAAVVRMLHIDEFVEGPDTKKKLKQKNYNRETEKLLISLTPDQLVSAVERALKSQSDRFRYWKGAVIGAGFFIAARPILRRMGEIPDED